MKKIICLFVLLNVAFVFAQQKGEITIHWTEKATTNVGDQKITLPQFDPLNFHFDYYTKQLFFNFKIRLTQEVNENSIQITNIVYENIPVSELGDLSLSATPTTPNATAKNIKSRTDLFAYISISPILKEGNTFKKIKSFSYSLNNSENRLSSTNNEFNTISNSVLNSGNWHRFYVVKSGVYRITKSFLSELGVNVDGVDPKKIKIYGNGGRMIPLKNSTYYPADLAENAIQVFGEEDGVFNNSDYILFYAEGVDQWSIDSQTTNNLYDSKSYYYINVQGNDGKRMTNMPQPSTASDVVITAFDDYQYHELDKVNIVRLGRRWFGEQFDFENQQEIDFKIPNIDTNTPVNVFVYAAAIATTSTSMEIKANNETAGNITFTPVGSSVRADWSTLSANITATENIRISLNYNNNGVPDSK